MSTRRAADDSEFRQEKFMSSPELEKGLLANCVARRTRVLENAEHRALIWFLQKLSHEPGGLDRAAAEMIALWPERFATKGMQALGFKRGRIYSQEEYQSARAGIPRVVTAVSFLFSIEEEWEEVTTFPAANLLRECLDAARAHFGTWLFEELCLNPATEINDSALWYLPALEKTLRDYMAHYISRSAERAPVMTEIGAKINETLDYALAGRCMVVIDGLARMGKTFAAKAWCDAHPGQARYVQVPSSNDDMSFFRAIGNALGVGGGRTAKAHELRDKIEDVAQTGDLLLLLDEGHYLWPQRNMRKAVPHRINWMLTQLVNMGVPVAICTTPQFTKSQETLVNHGGWSSEQLVGRNMHYEQLPASLSDADLEAVARFSLPGGDTDCIRMLVSYAKSSEGYLFGIEKLSRRARFLAGKNGREAPTLCDVKDALLGGVVPSDKAIQDAVTAAIPSRRQGRASTPFSAPLQSPCTPPATRIPTAPAEPSTSRKVSPALSLGADRKRGAEVLIT